MWWKSFRRIARVEIFSVHRIVSEYGSICLAKVALFMKGRQVQTSMTLRDIGGHRGLRIMKPSHTHRTSVTQFKDP